MVLWEATFITVAILGNAGLIFLFWATFAMKEELKKSMLLLFIAATFAVYSVLIFSALVVLQKGFENFVWNIPILFFVAAEVFYIVSMKKLADIFTDLTKE